MDGGYHGDAVGVDVAICGHRRCDLGHCMQLIEERRGRHGGGCRGQGGSEGHGRKSEYDGKTGTKTPRFHKFPFRWHEEF